MKFEPFERPELPGTRKTIGRDHPITAVAAAGGRVSWIKEMMSWLVYMEAQGARSVVDTDHRLRFVAALAAIDECRPRIEALQTKENESDDQPE